MASTIITLYIIIVSFRNTYRQDGITSIIFNKNNLCKYIYEDSGITTKNPKCYFSCNDHYLQSLHDLKKNIVLIYIFFLKNVELIMKST